MQKSCFVTLGDFCSHGTLFYNYIPTSISGGATRLITVPSSNVSISTSHPGLQQQQHHPQQPQQQHILHHTNTPGGVSIQKATVLASSTIQQQQQQHHQLVQAVAGGKTISLPFVSSGSGAPITLTKSAVATTTAASAATLMAAAAASGGATAVPVARVNPQPSYGMPTVQLLPQQASGGATIHRIIDTSTVSATVEQPAVTAAGLPTQPLFHGQPLSQFQPTVAAQSAAATVSVMPSTTLASLAAGNRPGILRRREGERDQLIPQSPQPPGVAGPPVSDDAMRAAAAAANNDDDGGSNSSGSTTLSATSCDNPVFSADEAAGGNSASAVAAASANSHLGPSSGGLQVRFYSIC